VGILHVLEIRILVLARVVPDSFVRSCLLRLLLIMSVALQRPLELGHAPLLLVVAVVAASAVLLVLKPGALSNFLLLNLDIANFTAFDFLRHHQVVTA